MVIFQPVHQAGQPRDDTPRALRHRLADDLWVIAARHEARAVGAESPDADAVLHACGLLGSAHAFLLHQGGFDSLAAAASAESLLGLPLEYPLSLPSSYHGRHTWRA